MLPAFSTRSNILETVDSPYSFVTFTFNTPLRFIAPDNISSPLWISLGTDSPVNAEVSNEPSPSKTIPSKGTLSPGLITIISSISTSSGDTFSSLLLTNLFA